MVCWYSYLLCTNHKSETGVTVCYFSVCYYMGFHTLCTVHRSDVVCTNRIESIVAPDPIRTRATATMRVVVGASRAPDGLLCEIMRASTLDARATSDAAVSIVSKTDERL